MIREPQHPHICPGGFGEGANAKTGVGGTLTWLILAVPRFFVAK